VRAVRRLGKAWLTLIVTGMFLVTSLSPKLATPAYAGVNDPAPPAPVPEDPMGQQPEQQAPEISIGVDVRDGHLTVRVVDIWGPGRSPLIVRTYTSTILSQTAVGNRWLFSPLLNAVDLGVDSSGKQRWAFLEPDGTQSVFKFSHRRTVGFEAWDVFVKDIGVYATMEMHCTLVGGACLWDGTHVLYLPKGVTRRYSQRLIQEIRDANGNATTYTTTTVSGQTVLWRVRDPVGREVTFDYTTLTIGAAQVVVVSRVTDPYGRQATYTYTAAGLLDTATNAAGRTTRSTYDAGGRLSGVTNARGHTTTIDWVPTTDHSRVSRVVAPDGAQTTYTYGPGGLSRTTMTDARGHATVFDVNAGPDESLAGNVERVTDSLGNVTQYSYDTRHNVTQIIDARGNRTTHAYNGRNRVTQVVRAAGTLNLTTTATWDDNDNQLSLTNPRGIRTDYTYNAQHNLTSARKAVGTAEEALTQYAYTPWGGVASVTDPRGNVTTYAYTARRQVQTITPPVGGTTTFTYNAVDDQVTRTDGNGRTWTTAFDVSRLVTSVTDPLNNVVRNGYDANGNRTSATDAKNQVTSFTYDTRDRLVTITNSLNGQTRYTYDGVGNLTQLTNARNFSTNFTYDAVSRLTQVRDALNQATTYAYDAVGNRTQQTDRKGQVQTFAYDQANRLTSTTAGVQTIPYTYDTNGNRLTMADPTGTTVYQYDNLDRQTRTTYPDGKTVQATYDRAGNRTSLTNPGAITTAATYDAANRLTQLTQGTLIWTFSYDAAGNRTRLTQPNGTSTDYAYLNNQWLQSTTHKTPGGAVLQSFTYTYDANGNRLTQVDSSGTTTIAYDALNRLTQAAYPAGFGSYTWTYDAVGNRTQQTAPAGSTSYTYDANNRLTQAGTTAYTYDANGNLTAISTGRTFVWDVFNRLTSTTASGSTATYTYNGDGLKVRRVGPNGTVNYYHDGSRPIWETNSAGAMTAQYDRDTFGNLLSRRDSANVRHYFHFDALGSTTALTNASGAVSATMLYDAWGNQRATTGSGHGNYRFTGSERDTTTGLYHMGARFYDPTVGRWLSEDPIQDTHFEPATLNFYAYALNNPALHTDPEGKAVWFIPVLVAGRAALAAWNLYSIAQVLMSDATLSAKVIQLILAGIGVKWPVGKFWAALKLVGRMGPYSVLSKLTSGFGHLIEAHHLIPTQIAHFFGLNAGDITSVIMWGPDHRSFTNALTAALQGVASKEAAWAELVRFYTQYRPDLLQRLLRAYPTPPF